MIRFSELKVENRRKYADYKAIIHNYCWQWFFLNFGKIPGKCQLSEAYLGPCETPLMNLFAKIISTYLLTVFTKVAIIGL